jgi:glycosyltransferase involved in cell wall biosynthesis
VGRVSKEKGLTDLCQLQDYYNIEIVGDGPYRRELERKFKHVKFLGYQQGVELANSYARADVFCFPSKLDTFGIVIIEAMAQGTPVAAYPVPGPVDIIDQEVTGYMAEDLATAIEHAIRLDRREVQCVSNKWTWDECWRIFKDNLI